MTMPSHETLLTSGRRWTFRILAGSLSILGLIALVAGPFTVMGDNYSMIGISVVALEFLVMLGGFIWLALLAKPDRDHPRHR